jgi:dTDP-4-dehydrorhamnose reductase
MKPRILLTGKSGQVGSELALLLPGLGEVITFDRHGLSLSNPEEIRRAIRTMRPHVIVNAAAYTAVEQAESDEAAARIVNADAPGIMAEEAKEIGALLVHYSTDYVFDGTKRTPYVEEDSTNPQNAYGRTKLAGEQAIQRSGAAHLIFRTAWVYARQGKNFLLTILKLASQREELRIVRDQIGAPTSSREIALATSRILANLLNDVTVGAMPAVSGVYHLTAAGETSWSEFAATILEEASLENPSPQWQLAVTGGGPLVARRVIPITTAEFPTRAARPLYSVLSNDRLARVFGVRLPDWRTQLRSLFESDPPVGI